MCNYPQHAQTTSWDKYWQQYEKIGYVNYTPQLTQTIQQYIQILGCRVLEIGAGTGGNSSILAGQGALVTALDISAPALQRTVATTSEAGVKVTLVQGDAYNLPFSNSSFELIFHQGFLEHFRDPLPLLREQKRVLRSKGYILIDVPQRYNWYTIHKRRLIRAGNWPYGGWEREFSLKELVKLLKSTGFHIVDTYARGYYPHLLWILRNLSKIESKLLKRKLLPQKLWNYYDNCWQTLEKSLLGSYLLQCIGVLAQA
ncbi:MAG: methyltransferase domain-containing protein [Chloroflexia bacterium]|nr:methyltransferase domain-containing protein [Chloroflexia bacterium]